MKSRLFVFLILLLFSATTFAMVPPSYLSVYRWKSCVSTYMQGSAELICLPSHKPLECPLASWKKLKRHSSLPYCPRHHHHHDHDDIGSSSAPIGSSSGSSPSE